MNPSLFLLLDKTPQGKQHYLLDSAKISSLKIMSKQTESNSLMKQYTLTDRT